VEYKTEYWSFPMVASGMFANAGVLGVSSAVATEDCVACDSLSIGMFSPFGENYTAIRPENAAFPLGQFGEDIK
jgi:hypothetical protein